MLASDEIRVRRPAQHEALVLELQTEGRFPAMRDVLVFAASVGFRNQRRVPFTASGEAIRYGVLTGGSAYSETLINMAAAAVTPEDPEIMDAARLQERVAIFEEFANGGLEYIQEQVNTRHQPAARVVLDIVADALAETGGAEPVEVDELMSGAIWG